MNGLSKRTEKGSEEDQVMWYPKKINYVIWKLFFESRIDSCCCPLSLAVSKNASTPSLFSFSPLVHSVSSAPSILPSPTACSWSAYRLSVTPPDNANWCQIRASRPLCLTPTPHFLISLVVLSHLYLPAPISPPPITSS